LESSNAHHGWSRLKLRQDKLPWSGDSLTLLGKLAPTLVPFVTYVKESLPQFLFLLIRNLILLKPNLGHKSHKIKNSTNHNTSLCKLMPMVVFDKCKKLPPFSFLLIKNYDEVDQFDILTT
jgi:hypothetical protein